MATALEAEAGLYSKEMKGLAVAVCRDLGLKVGVPHVMYLTALQRIGGRLAGDLNDGLRVFPAQRLVGGHLLVRPPLHSHRRTAYGSGRSSSSTKNSKT